MKKIMKHGMKSIENLAKKVAKESPNTLSGYLYYEPKMPEGLKKNVKVNSEKTK